VQRGTCAMVGWEGLAAVEQHGYAQCIHPAPLSALLLSAVRPVVLSRRMEYDGAREGREGPRTRVANSDAGPSCWIVTNVFTLLPERICGGQVGCHSSACEWWRSRRITTTCGRVAILWGAEPRAQKGHSLNTSGPLSAGASARNRATLGPFGCVPVAAAGRCDPARG
jgi:hypothetical protein